jgi:AcrR family transcriptional regulator
VNGVYFVKVIHETPPAPRSPRVRRTRARRHEAIEAAALDLIANEGFEALTMARLGQEVDLTPGALYRYFASKDALIVALQARALGRIEELYDADRAQRSWPRDPATRNLAELCFAARFYRRLARDEPRIFALVSVTVGDPRHLVADEHARAVAAPMASLLSRIATAFEAAVSVEALAPGDARVRAVIFWSAVHGVTSVAKLDRIALAITSTTDGLFSPAARVDELARALLAGWGACPTALAAAFLALETES